MARWKELTPKQEKELEEWTCGRPPHVEAIVRKYPPDRLYRIKETGHRGTIRVYQEHTDGSVTVSLQVDGRFNRVLFSRVVFGIKPEDIEECDLPAPGEDLGDTSQEAGYTQDDVKNILIPKLIEDAKKKEAE